MTYKPNEKVQSLLDAMHAMPEKPIWDSCDVAATMHVEQSTVSAYLKAAIEHRMLHKTVVNGRMLLSLQSFTAERLATAPSSAPPAFVPPRMGEARPVPPAPLGNPATKPRPAGDLPRPQPAVVTAPRRDTSPEPTPAPTAAPRANATGLGAWPKVRREPLAVAATPARTAAPTPAPTTAPVQAPAVAKPQCEGCARGECSAGCAAPWIDPLPVVAPKAPEPAAAPAFDAALRLDGSIRIYGADMLDDGSVRITSAQWNLLRERFAWTHA